jgi:uncharacterized membrane protein YqiK
MTVSLTALSGNREEEERAAEWITVVRSRDDVYDMIEETAASVMSGTAKAMLVKELEEEREMLEDLAKILGRLASEAAELDTPVLDSFVAELESHGTG